MPVSNFAKCGGMTLGQSAGVGAASGAVAGALVTLFEEHPKLKTLVRNTLAGGAGGAVIGSGAHAVGGLGAQVVPPGDSAPSVTPSISLPTKTPPKDMNVALAALTGAVPGGVGAAIHGGVSQGAGQAVGSGAAALAPSAIVTALQRTQGKPATRGSIRLTTPFSMIAAALAAHAGNKIRSQEP